MLLRVLERRSLPKSGDHQGWLRLTGGGARSTAGPIVNESTAMTHATVFACVRVLAESVAQLPFKVYLADGKTRDEVVQHWLYRLLHDAPNEELTSFELREWIMAYLCLRGNALLYKDVSEITGAIRGLWPIPWDQVRVERETTGERRLVYVWTPTGAPKRVFRREEVWHIKGMSFDGVVGFSPIAWWAETIGLGLAAGKYGSKFFDGNGHIAGVLEMDQPLSDEAKVRLEKSWEQLHGGLDNAHKVAVLEQGMKWSQIGLSAKDAQVLELRKFNRSELAGLLRVPLHMIQDLERATFSNIEHQGIQFVQHSLGPWLKRIEASATRDLVLEKDRGKLIPEFLVEGLLRGDTASRYASYTSATAGGWMTRNEVRAKENLPPLPGLDEPLEPMNMQAPGDGPEPNAPAPANPETHRAKPPAEQRAARELRDATRRSRIAESYRRVFREAAGRVVRAEIREVEKLVEAHLERRDAQSFESAIDNLYRDGGKLRGVIGTLFEPVVFALGESIFREAASEVEQETDESGLEDFLGLVAAALVSRHVGQSVQQLTERARGLAKDDEAISRLFDEWRESRPDRIARRETVQQSRAAAKQAYARSGVRFLRWKTVGANCPFCERLDGKVVGIEQNFVSDGDVLEAEGRKPLRAGNVGHPPLHRGCDCEIVPGG